MTTLELAQREERTKQFQLLQENFTTYRVENLKIKTKDSRIVPFSKLWPAQRKLEEAINKQIRDNKPVRVIVCKARQQGISTYSTAYMFWKTHMRENRTAFIVGHKYKSSFNLYNMVRGYFKNLPTPLKWGREYENTKLLKFEETGSQFIAETAGDEDIGKSYSISDVLMSERAYWERNCEPSLLSAVPNTPDTTVIIESTANLFGDAFHNAWLRAKRGQSEFIPVFIPWWLDENYSMALPPGFEMNENENEVKKLYNLTNEQMYWYHWTLENACNGNLNEMHKFFPSNDTEPFLTSGQQTFASSLKYIQQQYLRSQAIGCIQGELVVENGEIKLVETPRGWFKCWERPDIDYRYRMGVDSAEGKDSTDNASDPDSDYNCARIKAVRNNEQWKTVAEIHDRVDPDVFAYRCYLAAVWYLNAYIKPESNFTGREVIKALLRLKYKHIYKDSTKLISGRSAGVSDYGWHNDQKSRKELIAFQKECLRKQWADLVGEEACQEHLTFITDKNGKDQGGAGSHDDCVIADALANQACYEKSYIPNRVSSRSVDYRKRNQ